ncbi:Actin patch protein [Pleurostoma richardsiae]|uniref:Actin patch protein n=1 Tax=Pleurostoma richardsiae TaxID=41990 RepID=A0AA38VXN2_9PEZI|nr:Actin patch protein [Pleurostoma richardsiae]
MSQWGYRSGAYGGGYDSESATASPMPYERGSRRRKLAAMAGSVYRAGVAAASEIRDQYSNTRLRGVADMDDNQISIPGSFPDAAIVVQGDDQMVLFPSYAKRHIRQFKDNGREAGLSTAQANMNDEDYWRQEWARMEDQKAIVDVDVRGWVYSPHKGPMTRRNRVLIGLARRLSGIPAPTTQASDQLNMSTLHEDRESMREQQKIAREAEEIERRGQAEKEAAYRGGYSETPREDDSDAEVGGSIGRVRSRSGGRTPVSAPSSPKLTGRPSSNATTDLTEAELAVANANLMARLGPFLTNPLVQIPITLFFYNDETSQSRTVMTNDAGHFSIRAALDFVPTHVRVLANETLSATEPVRIIEDRGVSLISDIDDTIKKSSISMGAREIFRNTFIRDLDGLTIEGVSEWYNTLHEMGVAVHYCSNSPWQLFPVIATFFRMAALPPGSLHLKQYSGMLQGIFEPVAERKKGTLEKILRDFPQRRFLLVGDSGEADLEVYTELAVAHPGRILAVFIRDVTTPEQKGYFDAAFDPTPSRRSTKQSGRSRHGSGDTVGRSNNPANRPALPPRIMSEPPKADGPAMGTLIDFSDEPEEMTTSETQNLAQLMGNAAIQPAPATKAGDGKTGRKVPPPRPAKPAALRSPASDVAEATSPALPVRKPSGPKTHGGMPHPLAQMQNSSDQALGSNTSLSRAAREPATTPASNSSATTSKTSASAPASGRPGPPPPPPPRRRGTPSSIMSLSPRLLAHRRTNSSSDLESLDPLPPSAVAGLAAVATAVPASGPSAPAAQQMAAAANKKVDLWRRRLERAHDVLDAQGVQLYTWRRGDDVVEEAVGIVRDALGR